MVFLQGTVIAVTARHVIISNEQYQAIDLDKEITIMALRSPVAPDVRYQVPGAEERLPKFGACTKDDLHDLAITHPLSSHAFRLTCLPMAWSIALIWMLS